MSNNRLVCCLNVIEEGETYCPKCGRHVSEIPIPKNEKFDDDSPIEKLINNLKNETIGNSIRSNLEYSLRNMYKNGSSIAEIEKYYRETVTKINRERAAKNRFIELRGEEYAREAKLADKVYKAYVTDGISRLDKVNGRFLASLSIKTDVLIEQNNRIIELLAANLKDKNNLPLAFCPECGNQNINGTNYCENCGAKI